MVVDRGSQRVSLMARAKAAWISRKSPKNSAEKIHKVTIDPARDSGSGCDEVARKIGVPDSR